MMAPAQRTMVEAVFCSCLTLILTKESVGVIYHLKNLHTLVPTSESNKVDISYWHA